MISYSVVLSLLLNFHFSTTEVQAETTNPILNAFPQDEHIKLEWATEIPDEDVLYETSFETDDILPTLNYFNSYLDLSENRKYGGQSFSESESYSGSRSLMITNSFSNSNVYVRDLNNAFIYQDYSWASFIDNRTYANNGDDISLSFRAKTNGIGSVSMQGTGGSFDFGEPMDVYFLEDVSPGQKTVKISDTSIFVKAIQNGEKFHLANEKGRYSNYVHPVSVDQDNSTITLNTGFKGRFQSGDPLLKHGVRHPVTFSYREVDKNKGWQLFNMNTKVKSYKDFNTSLRGFYLVIKGKTRDTVYIDDIKLGYATESELYRGNTLLYRGMLSDYTDKSARDTEPPNPIESIKILVNDDNKNVIHFTEPEDLGTYYTYHVQTKTKDGSTIYTSDEVKALMKSGISGYSYIIDKNKDTSPNGLVNHTNGEIILQDDIFTDHYLHIQVVDRSGNASEVRHFPLKEIVDLTPPSIELSQTPTEWTNKNVTINIKATDDHSGIKKLTYIGDNMVKNGDFSEGDKYWEENSGVVEISTGLAILRDQSVAWNKFLQRDAFKESPIGSNFFAELTARGQGDVNVRYGDYNGGQTGQRDYKKTVTSEFKTYSFILTRTDKSTDSLVIEKVGKGSIEISGVKVFSQKEITDNKLEVTQNGTYTFAAEDNEGNITTKSITINNIDKTEPEFSVSEENNKLSITASDRDGSGVCEIKYGWSNHPNSSPNVMTPYKGEKIDKPNTVGYHYLFVAAKDCSGNESTNFFNYTLDGELQLEIPQQNELKFHLNGDNQLLYYQVNNVHIKDTRLSKTNWNITAKSTAFSSNRNSIGYLLHSGVSTENSVTVISNNNQTDSTYTDINFLLEVPKQTKIGIYINELTFTISPF